MTKIKEFLIGIKAATPRSVTPDYGNPSLQFERMIEIYFPLRKNPNITNVFQAETDFITTEVAGKPTRREIKMLGKHEYKTLLSVPKKSL